MEAITCLVDDDVVNRRDVEVARASASQFIYLGFNPLVESYQNALKNVIHSFPAWRSAFSGVCGEQADKFACCAIGQGTKREAFFMWKTDGPDSSQMATPKRVRTFRPKYRNTICFLAN